MVLGLDVLHDYTVVMGRLDVGEIACLLSGLSESGVFGRGDVGIERIILFVSLFSAVSVI
jgi:hypothetical protein